MDESELVKWMRQVESRLRVLEGEPASTAAQTASKPPALEELLAKIGRQM